MIVTFSKSLYAREAVDLAVRAYAGHARAEIEETGDDVVVHLDAAETTADHFANHVLFETVRIRIRTKEQG